MSKHNDPTAKADAQLEQRLEKVEAATAELRELTSEAHSAIKQLRTIERTIRHLLDTEVHTIVASRIDTEVKAGLASFEETIRAANAHAVETVSAEFDKLADLFIRGSGASREHIVVAAHEAREVRREALRFDPTGGGA